ncbi:MAG TPA: UBP-type zinc finger domain-containing protein [Acidimicrobiia bacterium]|nr:UBP-type zinc finger domain-containing protein [Acidimicrobiia bacterium]
MSVAECTHLDEVEPVEPGSWGCEDCLAVGDEWFHLRVCMTCGHVGCCDSSKNRHASKHAAAVSHPIVQSYEPGEEWCWCFVDELAFILDGVRQFTHP